MPRMAESACEELFKSGDTEFRSVQKQQKIRKPSL